MIVKDNAAKRFPLSSLLWVLGAAIALIALVYFIQGITRSGILDGEDNGALVIRCDAEEVVSRDHKRLFKQGDNLFGWGELQNGRFSKSGKFACKVSQKNPWGLTFDLAPHVHIGDRFEVSVWRYRGVGLTAEYGGKLIVNFDEMELKHETNKAEERLENGWELLNIRFQIPANYQGTPVKVFVYHTDGVPCWFDDLRIARIESDKNLAGEKKEEITFEKVNLRISEKGMRKLKDKRVEAFRNTFLVTGDDDWAKGKIGRGDEEVKVKLRLKGDLLDHLLGDKWSFRLKAKAPDSWNRLMTFSFQNPGTRNFLSEWVYHEFLKKEDILCPRYDFIRLSINGESRGPYAYEEHFEKQLLEFRGRREGPIVKFSEEGMWQARVRDRRDYLPDKTTEQNLNQYSASEVSTFRQSRVLADPKLAQQFELAQSLMESYKKGEKSVDEVFDLDRLARYYAITDICKAYHGVFWHNQRFYYNPVISKLEPIGYDGFVYGSAFNWVGKPFFLFERAALEGDGESDLVYKLFFDQEFVPVYLKYLWEYSEKEKVEDFFFDVEEGIRRREQLIQEEFTDYSFDKSFFTNSAHTIRSLMVPMANSLRAYPLRGKSAMEVTSTHPIPLQIVGYGSNKAQPETRLASPIWLKPHGPETPLEYQILDFQASFLFYQVPGLDSVYVAAVSQKAAPPISTPEQKLFADINLQSNDVYQVEGTQVIFPAGDYQVAEDIVIPAGHTVRFDAGVSLDLIKGAAFVSRSAVQMYGDEEAPIRIFSSDKSAHGFTVLQAKKASTMSYVTFQGMNTLIKDGWVLTGAVSMYESDVTIHQCSFTDNSCEDALNLIRCDFSMDKCLIARTFADGFDADFCKGEIRNSRFVETGNDGMDFSGSVIKVIDCEVLSPGDKGISVGEEATVHVVSATISNAILGLASKDLSKLKIDFIKLENCETGFSAYQKKPEYGPAFIDAKQYEINNVKRLHLIEKGSKLLLKGQAVETI